MSMLSISSYRRCIVLSIIPLLLASSVLAQQLQWRAYGGRGGAHNAVMTVTPSGSLYLVSEVTDTIPPFTWSTMTRSDDHGASWHLVRDSIDLDGPVSISAISDSILLVLFGDGFYRSADSGKTWEATLKVDINWSQHPFIAATGHGSAVAKESDTLYLSLDGAASWNRMAWPLPGIHFETIQPLAGGGLAVIYDSAYYVTRDFVHWRTVVPLPGYQIKYLSTNSSGLCAVASGFDTLRISTDDGLTWLVRGQVSEQTHCWPNGDIVTYAYSEYPELVLKRSTDTGRTWQPIGVDKAPGSSGDFLADDSTDGMYTSTDWLIGKIVHTSQSGIECDPVLDNVNGIAAAAGGPVILSDRWGDDILRSSNGGRDWLPVTYYWPERPKSYWIGRHPKVGYVVADFYGGYNFYDDNTSKHTLHYSTDGSNWIETSPMPTHFGTKPAKASPSVLGFDRHGNIYLKWWSTLYMTSNLGQTYRVTPFGLDSNYSYPTLIDLPDGTLMLGVKGGIQESTDQGLTWQFVGAAHFDNPITSIACDSNGVLMACTALDGVFQSTDEGAHWQKFSNGLKGDTSINMLCYSVEGFWLAATSHGVFTLKSGTNEWQSASDGLEDLDINTIAIGGAGEYYAGTSAEGVFTTAPEAAIHRVDGPIVGFGITGYPNPSSRVLHIGIDLPRSGECDIRLLDIRGNTVRVLASGDAYAGHHNFLVDHIGLASGKYFVRVLFMGTVTTLPIIFDY